VATAATAGALASGTFGTDQTAEDAAAAAGTTQPPGTYGAPLPDRPEPTEVAVDPPRTTAPPARDEPTNEDAVDEATGDGADEDTPADAEPADVEVLITWSGWAPDPAGVEAGGYVDVVETGGSCTLTLTNGSATVSVTSAATPDVSSTTCGPMFLPGDQVTPGPWRSVLSYESPLRSGRSDAVEVTVP
jgi:hypothetical protein